MPQKLLSMNFNYSKKIRIIMSMFGPRGHNCIAGNELFIVWVHIINIYIIS